MDKAISIMDMIIGFLSANAGTIGSVLGVVLFIIAKAKSTEQAVGVVSAIQKVVDMVAKVVKKAGEILQALADLLANLIKSDGIGGKP